MQRLHGLGLDLREPPRRVSRDPGSLQHAEQPLPLALAQRGRDGRVDHASKRDRDDEHRPAHAQDLQKGAVLVQGRAELLPGEATDAGPEAEIDGSRIGGVDADEVASDPYEVARYGPPREVGTNADPASALGRIDPVHGARGYLARRPELR